MPDLVDGDRELRRLLGTLDPKAREDLRLVLIRDQADRDAISSRLMRYRQERPRSTLTGGEIKWKTPGQLS